MLSGLALKLAGAAAVAAVIAGGLWRIEVLGNQRDTARASLLTALEANATLIQDRDRYRASAAAEAQRAGDRQREREGMAAQLIELRQALGDDACAWTPERAKAVDKFLGGDAK